MLILSIFFDKKCIVMKKLRKIPYFKTEDEEREFWDTHDTTEYFDYSHAIKMSFPNLKFSNPKTINKILQKVKEENSLSK